MNTSLNYKQQHQNFHGWFEFRPMIVDGQKVCGVYHASLHDLYLVHNDQAEELFDHLMGEIHIQGDVQEGLLGHQLLFVRSIGEASQAEEREQEVGESVYA